ncbi:MAG: DUF4783 domain-containing protein [Ignavibacteria bacterium]|nr:DUF4783 domain-containing protein [Ignavibacteria bacterium]MBI3765942.1 DUF4783 domain-containing protein [Ignavibacteriales bacterium]
MKKLIASTILSTFLVGAGSLEAFTIATQDSQERSIQHLALFDEIEKGLIAGDVRAISKYFGREVFLNLRGTESGYFSANQAFYILQNYFSARHTVHFKFTTFDQTESSPYATGGGSFMVKGKLETLQVYVALARRHERWVITQFNAY